MIGFGDRRRGGAPVILGNDSPGIEMPRCDACGVVGDAEAVRLAACGGEQVAAYLCRDAAACCGRYRGSLSANTFAAMLAAEALTHPAVSR